MPKPDRISEFERFVICFGRCQVEVWAEEKFRVQPLDEHTRFAEVIGRIRRAMEEHFNYRYSDEEFTSFLDTIRGTPGLEHILREARESQEERDERHELRAAKRQSDAAWKEIENSKWGPIGCIAVVCVAIVASLGYSVYNTWLHEQNKPEPTGVAKVPVWIDQLRGDDEMARKEAVEALVKLGPEAKEAATPLFSLLYDKRPTVRRAAVIVLGAINNEHVRRNIGHIQRLLNDDDPEVRTAAKKADEDIQRPPPIRSDNTR